MTDISSRFRAAINLEQSEPSTMFFYARLIEDRLAELQSDRWATSERLLDSLGAPLFRSAAPQQESVVVQQDGALLHVMLYSGYVHAQAAAADEATAKAALARLRDVLPAPEPVARHDVPVTFWTYTPNDPCRLCAPSPCRAGRRSS